ncbi:hypothetical protein WDW37_14665 [Bdellovibrionota bacterium FG-1]
MNRILRGQILFVFICVGILAGTPSAARAETLVVKAPCSDDAKSGLHGCQAILVDGIKPSGQMKTAIPSVVALLTKKVKAQIEGDKPNGIFGYYDHKDPGYKEFDKDGHLVTVIPDGEFGPTVCNLVGGGPFEPKKAEGMDPNHPVDHLGRSCGTPVKSISTLEKDGGTRVGSCFLLGPPPIFPPTNVWVKTTIDKTWSADPAKAYGTLEDGYMRGSLLQATTCFYQQVVNEIKDKHQLTVSTVGPDIPSPCLILAKNFSFLSKSHQDSVASLAGQLQGQANIEDILNFDKTWDTTKTGAIDMGPLRQSAQYLASARGGLEVMFTQLAACEIFTRAQFSYVGHFGTPEKQKAFMDLIISKIASPCSSDCKTKLHPSDKDPCHLPTDEKISECANTCHQGTVGKALGDYFKSLWPNNGQCTVLK